jgi:hypothetical protein
MGFNTDMNEALDVLKKSKIVLFGAGVMGRQEPQLLFPH